jgi:hypothetical protein
MHSFDERDFLLRQPYLRMPAVLALRPATAIAIMARLSFFVSTILFSFFDGSFY